MVSQVKWRCPAEDADPAEIPFYTQSSILHFEITVINIYETEHADPYWSLTDTVATSCLEL